MILISDFGISNSKKEFSDKSQMGLYPGNY
jgi:hypothetical protein